MKLLSFAAIVAGAGIAQVLAMPLMLMSSNNQNSPSFIIRVGHAVPMPDDVSKPHPQMMKMKKGPCRGRRFNQKAVEVSNFFRQYLGLPLIQAGGHPGHDGYVKMLPHMGGPPAFPPPRGNGLGWVKANHGYVPQPYPPHPPHGHHHGHHGHHHHHGHHLGKGSFINRIHYSLMNLGRWEGRAVAFVLGCGIGVLLRMMWVLAVVLYRAVKGQRGDEHEYSQITIIEEIVDSPKSVPPTYPVDEKVPVDAVKAPNTAEESK